MTLAPPLVRLSSMTGFARAEGRLGPWAWGVEARSVNGRNLEVRFRGPPGFDNLERLTREAMQGRFQRGQIGVTVQARRTDVVGQGRINLEALERYLQICEPYVTAGRAAPPAMDGLLALRGVIETGEDSDDAVQHAETENAMAASISQALDGLRAARLQEGAALASLLDGFLNGIQVLLESAEGEALEQPLMIRQRFQRRLIELAGEAVGADRILQEAAAMAIKADVREELDRLAGHVAGAWALLADTGAAGRRLDFLTQEFMREANTLCAKSATPALTAIGLDLKAVIDRFREQVQNVE
jgi:uncharacterized protein (TIGR00255 family)